MRWATGSQALQPERVGWGGASLHSLWEPGCQRGCLWASCMAQEVFTRTVQLWGHPGILHDLSRSQL